MGNFFKELADCEKMIFVEKSCSSCDGEVWEKLKETRHLLARLIQFVESGELVSSSEASKFICKNFRLDSVEMTKAWNIKYQSDKSNNTFRSQISTLSRKFYKLFGHDIYTLFAIQDADGLQKIKVKLNALQSVDISFDDLFFSELSSICRGDGEIASSNLHVEDCNAELEFMRKILKSRFISALGKYDVNKLAYIRYILNTPLVDSKGICINEQKIKMLKALGVSLHSAVEGRGRS